MKTIIVSIVWVLLITPYYSNSSSCWFSYFKQCKNENTAMKVVEKVSKGER